MQNESNKCFGSAISGVGWEGEGGPLCIQNISDLILKKKQLPLIIELVVSLNHLGALLWYERNVTRQSSKYCF